MSKKYVAWREPGHHSLRPAHRRVFGAVSLAYLKRRAKRMGYTMVWMEVSSKRDLMFEWMRWALHHESTIHYTQLRPMRYLKAMKNRVARLYVDCSETVTGCFYAAGIRDPNRRGYDGMGNTQSIRASLPHKALSRLEVGDPIVYGGSDLRSQHVAQVYHPHRTDPVMFSMGQDSGPRLYRHSIEARAHGGRFSCHDAGV